MISSLHHVKNAEIAKLLIENGANVNAKDVFGYAPLHYTRNADIAKLLVDNGADINAKEANCQSKCNIVKVNAIYCIYFE